MRSPRPMRSARLVNTAARRRPPRSTVSSICGQIKHKAQPWRNGASRTSSWIACSWTPRSSERAFGSSAEPVLAACCITTGGKPAFVGLAPGSGEFADSWHDFLQDLSDRGLLSPLPVISDAVPV